MSLIYIVALLALMFSGIPVAASLVIVGIAGVLLSGVPVSIIGQRIAFGLDNFTLIAIPMFLLMGNLLNASGITKRIFDFAVSMVGHWRAGLAHVNVLGSLVFAGMSGSALADAAGIGSMQIREMKANGYSASFSAAITAAASTIAPVIPPSTVAILYAFLADVSAGRMFLAGVVPGLIMTVTLMVTINMRAGKLNVPVTPRTDAQTRLKATWRALPALVVPFAMIGGMRTGIFTATEAAAVGALYAVILAFVVYRRETSSKDVIAAFRDTALATGGIMLIVASANVFAWILARDRIPQEITAYVTEMHLNPMVLLLVLNVVLLILGMILDASAILILVTPVVVPAVTAVGIDPVHFGMMMTINMMIGMLTPPVGLALFIVADIAKSPLATVAKETIPYIIGFLVVLMLVTFIPQISLWLPNLVYGAAQ
jgi:tripartite ATP-independent transporter DctM subunit